VNQIVPITNAEVYRASTDAAGLCKEIVLKTAMEIQRRKYVKVEGWQAIAIAHGCAAGARDVEAIEGGVRAIGEIKRMSDGIVIATAEGFVGEDEPTWYGGQVTDKWGKTKTLPKRPDYAIRAMAQTRAISRACRSAFAHVVVLIDASLSTTPAEEVPYGGFDDRAEAAVDVTPKTGAKTAFTKTANTPLEAFVAAMKMNKTIEAVDAWASREANAIMEKLDRKGQADMQTAYEDWRNECAAREPELVSEDPLGPDAQ
jgi:hypothetical protein